MDNRKLNIVFVDEDYHVLNHIKHDLNHKREYWKMSFFENALDALQYIKFNHIDVVVTSFSEPGCEGGKLLAKTYEMQPESVRLVLAKADDSHFINPASLFCHSFLVKPCQSSDLINIIEKSTRIRYRLNDINLIKQLHGLETLPAMPSLYRQILDELNAPNSSMRTISLLIERDPGVTAKILQLVNSAYFGLPREIESIAEALSFLGLDIVRSLFLSVNLFSAYEDKLKDLFDVRPLWQHNLRVGHVAARLALHAGAPERVIQESRTAGVLHDIGILILADSFPEKFMAAITMMKEKNIHLNEAELKTFHSTHGDIGAYLMCLWGLPDPIVEAIAFQHHPRDAGNETFSALTAVHVANVIDLHQTGYAFEGQHRFDENYLRRVGYTVPHLSDLH